MKTKMIEFRRRYDKPITGLEMAYFGICTILAGKRFVKNFSK